MVVLKIGFSSMESVPEELDYRSRLLAASTASSINELTRACCDAAGPKLSSAKIAPSQPSVCQCPACSAGNTGF